MSKPAHYRSFYVARAHIVSVTFQDGIALVRTTGENPIRIATDDVLDFRVWLIGEPSP